VSLISSLDLEKEEELEEMDPCLELCKPSSRSGLPTGVSFGDTFLVKKLSKPSLRSPASASVPTTWRKKTLEKPTGG